MEKTNVSTFVNISIPVYSDGVQESEEGFVILMVVSREDLDERDVGFVNVLDQVVLVRVLEGDTRFEVLAEDVTLEQSADLLQYAALPEDQVTVGVVKDVQTVIVEAGAEVLLNFNHYFRLAPQLLSADNVTATITRQLLDESGRPLAETVEVLSPVEGRVSVSSGGEGEQHFVSIASARVNDSGVYTIEVCSERGLPEEVCVNVNATLFVLDSVPGDLGLSFLIAHSTVTHSCFICSRSSSELFRHSLHWCRFSVV